MLLHHAGPSQWVRGSVGVRASGVPYFPLYPSVDTTAFDPKLHQCLAPVSLSVESLERPGLFPLGVLANEPESPVDTGRDTGVSLFTLLFIMHHANVFMLNLRLRTPWSIW
jgi:hypothetical protein